MRRLTTETKQFFKTSEFWVYSAILLGILIAGLVIEQEEGGPDIFAADKVWLYATILTAAYLLSRGLAKSGVRDPYWDAPDRDRDGHSDGAPIGQRVKAAAQILTEGPDAVSSGQHQQPQHQQPQHQQPQHQQPQHQQHQQFQDSPTQPVGHQPPPPDQRLGV